MSIKFRITARQPIAGRLDTSSPPANRRPAAQDSGAWRHTPLSWAAGLPLAGGDVSLPACRAVIRNLIDTWRMRIRARVNTSSRKQTMCWNKMEFQWPGWPIASMHELCVWTGDPGDLGWGGDPGWPIARYTSCLCGPVILVTSAGAVTPGDLSPGTRAVCVDRWSWWPRLGRWRQPLCGSTLRRGSEGGHYRSAAVKWRSASARDDVVTSVVFGDSAEARDVIRPLLVCSGSKWTPPMWCFRRLFGGQFSF